ncbi:hypothetical protein WDZ92_46915 [Nostoc sp. NIES-2111]
MIFLLVRRGTYYEEKNSGGYFQPANQDAREAIQEECVGDDRKTLSRAMPVAARAELGGEFPMNLSRANLMRSIYVAALVVATLGWIYVLIAGVEWVAGV